ncbi:MAG: phenylalanine--tRNA ligase subunit beta [Patescibacteria group bacterium]
MNILASYTWLKDYVKTDLAPEDLAREFSLRSMSVEAIELGSEKFAGMVVGIIQEVKAHPKADKLRIAVTDVGDKVVEIVCGGSNLEIGQKVFVALPGSKVKWHGEGDLVELQETEIRGVKSVGMICAPAEVGFEKVAVGEHEIWDLTALTTASAGTPIMKALALDEAILDIEVTTNRPDCMGMVGLAREVAASLNAEFTVPELSLPVGQAGPSVVIEAQKLCPRYLAATVKNVTVGPSPWWLQKRLLEAGHRPINNIVDITNYVLHEYGQPLHAFDADQIKTGITVRLAKKGEKFLALDGKDYTLSTKQLVIADTECVLAVAGVMGGLDSGTTTATTTVIFEAATFEAVSIRRTARELNLYSDSQLLFEKGLSTQALPLALARALELVKDLAGGELVGITDIEAKTSKVKTFPVLFKRIRARIGVEIADAEICAILTRLGFALSQVGARTVATVPYWREHDLEAEVDLTEEVARMYGYHMLPLTLPSAPPPTLADDAGLVWEAWTKNFLASVGYTEFFGYSFIDVKSLEKFGLSPLDAVKLHNPLAEDLSHLRPSLLPSLLRDIERNQANMPAAKVFEVARVHLPQASGLPSETFRLVVAEYGCDEPELAYRQLRGVLELFARKTGMTVQVAGEVADSHWHPVRSVTVSAMLDGVNVVVGSIGQVADAYQRAFGIIRPVFVLDLDLERLLPHLRQTLAYTPVSEFPIVTRDLSCVVSDRTQFVDLESVIKSQNILVRAVQLVDIYRGKGVEEGKKSVTLSMTFASPERTLTSEEVEEIMLTIGHTLTGKFGAVLRS